MDQRLQELLDKREKGLAQTMLMKSQVHDDEDAAALAYAVLKQDMENILREDISYIVCTTSD